MCQITFSGRRVTTQRLGKHRGKLAHFPLYGSPLLAAVGPVLDTIFTLQVRRKLPKPTVRPSHGHRIVTRLQMEQAVYESIIEHIRSPMPMPSTPMLGTSAVVGI